MKILNLSHSRLLIKTPDFSKLPNLEKLILEDCSGLKYIDQSVGCLQRLVQMNVQDWKRLRSVPSGICRLKFLQNLNISGCSNIDRLPDDLGEMHSLSVFHTDEMTITQLPPSMVSLMKLTKLSLGSWKRFTSRSISSLIWSCISSQEVPKDSYQLTSSLSGLIPLTELSLRDCNLYQMMLFQ